jgi:membrane-associated phospholipid phosphatase
MNQAIFNFLFSFSHNQALAQVSVFVSNILIYILALVIIIFVFLKARPLFLKLFVLFGSVIVAGILSKILKTLLSVPRPFIAGNFIPVVHETGFSLPSTHATAFATLTIVAFSMNRKLGIIFGISTLLIGLSRVILGVHYPFDVLLGFALGALIGLLFVHLGKSPRVVAFFSKSL